MKKKKKIDAFDIGNYLFMVLLILIMIYPMYFTIIASISDPSLVATGEIWLLPEGINFDAYKNAFGYDQIWVGYANTIFYTVFGTIFSLFLTIPTAYAISKKTLPFRGFFQTVFLIPMYFSGGMVPMYLLVKNLGLINSRMTLVVVGAFSIYNMIVTRSFFTNSIPDSLYEAAEIDGAGEVRTFFSVALPLSKPIIAVMTLYYAVSQWNSYFNALLYISDQDLEPLQSVLRRLLIQNENVLKQAAERGDAEMLAELAKQAYVAYAMKFAVVFIASAPLLIAYPFVQKYFVQGVMIGAVKE